MTSRFPALAGLLILFTMASVARAQDVSGPAVPAMQMAENGAWQTAVHAADLSEIFFNSGPFTVFAPTETALEQYLESRGEVLMNPENKQQLRSLVSYHIVAGRITASRILRQLCRGQGVARFTTVQGEELLASIEGTDIILMDCSGNRARIVQADGGRDNVVYHEIDTVIQPRPNP